MNYLKCTLNWFDLICLSSKMRILALWYFFHIVNNNYFSIFILFKLECQKKQDNPDSQFKYVPKMRSISCQRSRGNINFGLSFLRRANILNIFFLNQSRMWYSGKPSTIIGFRLQNLADLHLSKNNPQNTSSSVFIPTLVIQHWQTHFAPVKTLCTNWTRMKTVFMLRKKVKLEI